VSAVGSGEEGQKIVLFNFRSGNGAFQSIKSLLKTYIGRVM